ncbi:MAG TPA: Gfo/Idh/MocA family oxidoreductase [Abditibacteriaceae bacterium]|jgi:predicted dehydrogenase
MAKESVVIAGAGGISNAWFPPLLAEKVEIRAVVDLNPANAERQCKKYGVSCEVSNDLPAMLKKHQPDFVLDLTIPDAHFQVTTTALKHGCHVIGEKPMAATLQQARKMITASEESGKLFMTSQSRRWDKNLDVAQRALAGGKLGEITTINCDFYIGAHFGGFRDEMASPLILDMSIHHFDLARYFTGLDAVAVYAHEFNPKGSWYKGDVAATCLFEMSNGAIFTYRGSWCAEGCHTSWNGDWRFIGVNGTLLCEKDAPQGEIVAGKDGFHRPKKELKLPAPKIRYGGMHGALREMLTFLRGGPKPQTECRDNFKSLAMVLAAIESSRKGKKVLVPQS